MTMLYYSRSYMMMGINRGYADSPVTSKDWYQDYYARKVFSLTTGLIDKLLNM